MPTTVAEFIARVLAEEGVQRFYVLTGGDSALWAALEHVGIDPILCRSEFSSVYMADGFAQRSGQLGVTYGQSGPGAANVAAALADPYWSRTPIIAITGGTATTSVYRNEYQELDTMPMLETVTAANFALPSPDRIVDTLPQAIALARKFGPVNLTVPRNLFAAELSQEPSNIPIPVPTGAAAPDPVVLAQAVKLIDRMHRPLILAGTGAKRAGRGEMLLQLGRKLDAPIATSPGGKGVVPDSDPLVMGVIGRYAGKAANQIASEADGFIVAGSRIGGLVTDGYRFGAGDTPVVHIDHDMSSFAAHPGPGIRLHSDLGPALMALENEAGSNSERTEWSERAQAVYSSWHQEISSLEPYGDDGSISPHALFPILNAAAEDLTVVADTGYMAAWTAVLFEPSDEHGYYRANGSLGWSFPAALGIQVADMSRRVVCVTGDGGMGYHIGDLETAVRRRLPVIVLVFNNQSLAFEYHDQKYKFGEVVPAYNDFIDLDYAEVARAFGGAGERVHTLEEFADAFTRARGDSSRPYVIDIVVDKEAFGPVTNFDKLLNRPI